ncbi:PKD domain-containing protein [Flavobacterium sp. FlaQc-28]|uniref:PKD domain-containing protein n=1 Tax=Flavobacterium sp. FlaQc-28 TaxID=3374178 RepID=UPI003757A5AE
MNSYYIDIIDQELNQSHFIIEKTSRAGVVLAWNGGDAKDNLSVVGSSLEFDIAHNELVDAKFINFFTGNEIRFSVELRNQSDDALLWKGFLIPDTYSEPYTNSVTFVKITASCGLGRLKGKYLPEDYYRDEKSVVDILCKCLSLTSLGLNVFFNPAIENSIQKDWDQIYLDTSLFYTDSAKKKKQDAYSVLEDILKDTLCVCYQADNRWNIEGLNKRHVRTSKSKLYDIEGNLLTEIDDKKLLKRITSLVTPTITMVPPYNLITVSHERKPQAFPVTIDKESNEGWSVVAGVIGEIYATDWSGNADFYCEAYSPNYINSIKKEYYVPAFGDIPVVTPFDETKFISLKNKIYLYQYQKVVIKAEFTIIKYDKEMTGILPGAYLNPLLYQFLLNDETVFSNHKAVVPENEVLLFDEGKAELNFEWIVPFDGLLDVKLWRPGDPIYQTNIEGFEITKLEISPVAFEEQFIVTDVITDEFTVDKEIELTYSDDDSAFSNSFRLAKLNEANLVFNTILIPVLYSFSQNGNFYSVVNLKGANLIKDNINTVVYNGDVLENVEVIYNYMSTEEMVVKTDFEISSGNFSVNVYKNNDVLGGRNSWLQWTDSVYKIETDRYQKTVCNVIRRMFAEASEKLDVVALNAVKFNDLILFHYVNDKQFVVTNCSWNLDENKTTLILARSIYRDSGDSGENPENIPPIVNAGPDIILENDQKSIEITAVAYDVDGSIVSQQWTKTLGGFGDIIVSPNQLSTKLENLTEDQYQYKIEVKDNDGATAVDMISIVRRKNYNVFLDEILAEGNEGTERIHFQYKFRIDPNVDPSFNLLLVGRAMLSNYNQNDASFKIFKNGVKIFEYNLALGWAYQEPNFEIGYISTSEIVFDINQAGRFPAIHFGSSYVFINEIKFITGAGNIVGLPLVGWPVPNPFITP